MRPRPPSLRWDRDVQVEGVRPAKILAVGDIRENLVAFELLQAPDRKILTVTSGREALDLMLDHDFALALLGPDAGHRWL
jgi:hypothetical protein